AGFLYLFDGDTGQLLDTILPPVNLPGGHFGATIAVVGNRICVQQELGGPSSSGRVYILDAAGALVDMIDDPSPSMNADFGGAMCEYDGALVVGAPMQDVGTVAAEGVVYIFKVN